MPKLSIAGCRDTGFNRSLCL